VLPRANHVEFEFRTKAHLDSLANYIDGPGRAAGLPFALKRLQELTLKCELVSIKVDLGAFPALRKFILGNCETTLHGAGYPNLASLNLIGCSVTVADVFPTLRSLTVDGRTFNTASDFAAPHLRKLSLIGMENANTMIVSTDKFPELREVTCILPLFYRAGLYTDEEFAGMHPCFVAGENDSKNSVILLVDHRMSDLQITTMTVNVPLWTVLKTSVRQTPIIPAVWKRNWFCA